MNPVNESVIAMKVLSNAHRFSIMDTLIQTDEDLCVNEIAQAVGISQSLASQQLSYLQAHGIIEGHRKGKTICYLPSNSSLTSKIKRVIDSLT